MRTISEVAQAAAARGWTLARRNVGYDILDADGAKLGADAWRSILGHDPARCLWTCRCGQESARPEFAPPAKRLRGKQPTHGADPRLMRERKLSMIARRRAGWTMAKIAAAFGLTASAVQRIIGPGIRALEPDSLHAPPDLAGYLGAPEDKLARRAWIQDKLAEGVAVEEIGRALEVTPTTIRHAAGMI